ncbi:uncharacterized protein BKCO1_36000111 [Diplodia corticola]|uniref:Uncharacterized protein n=1 Tax=Diplodia corticola TaxID=236234 RepID=A0A1J9RWL0_9PEZI|nr:uncharacterized protein BKCO1_36000111 [Diplodia corticola]OJD32759.1 hypothetical protein BKCO1_36000111 [Diplodia corticola]
MARNTPPSPPSPSHNSPPQSVSGDPAADRRSILFKRLFNILPQLNLLAALTASASIGALTFDEFHPTLGPINCAAEGLLTSCAISATASIMLSTMLMFRFEALEVVLKKQYLLLWTPLVLLDWSILALLIGITLWYLEKNATWRAALMVAQVSGLLGFSVWVAVRMAITMRREGGIGGPVVA